MQSDFHNTPAAEESDEASECTEEASFELPPGLRVAAAAPDELALQVLKDNVAADALVGRTIMYNWHEAGWCVGTITGRNADKRHKVNAQGECTSHELLRLV